MDTMRRQHHLLTAEWRWTVHPKARGSTPARAVLPPFDVSLLACWAISAAKLFRLLPEAGDFVHCEQALHLDVLDSTRGGDQAADSWCHIGINVDDGHGAGAIANRPPEVQTLATGGLAQVRHDLATVGGSLAHSD
jgi:hypothetical protein